LTTGGAESNNWGVTMKRILFSMVVAVVAVGGVTTSGDHARAAGPRVAPKKIPLLAVLVAKTFLRALVDRDLKTAAPLCAATVDFDGHQVKGEKAVLKRLRQVLARMKVRRRLRKVAVLTLAQARRISPSGGFVGVGSSLCWRPKRTAGG